MIDRDSKILEIRNYIADYYRDRLLIDSIGLAEKIYQIILPRDSIVLTREELEHPTDEKVIEFFANHNAKVRKTTTSEIYTLINEKCDLEFNICDGRLYHVGYQAALRDIKKCLEERFGEEIKG